MGRTIETRGDCSFCFETSQDIDVFVVFWPMCVIRDEDTWTSLRCVVTYALDCLGQSGAEQPAFMSSVLEKVSA